MFGGLKLNKRYFDFGRLKNISILHLSQIERLPIPRTLLPIVKDKFRDALWVCILPAQPLSVIHTRINQQVRSYWEFKALMEMAREDPQQILSDDFASCGDFPENIVDKEREEGSGVDDSALSEKSNVRSWIGASLW